MIDTVTYQTTADDGCVLVHVIDVGREWMRLDPISAWERVGAQITEWRTLALAWHDKDHHGESAA